jgi:hypothetical protein
VISEMSGALLVVVGAGLRKVNEGTVAVHSEWRQT